MSKTNKPKCYFINHPTKGYISISKEEYRKLIKLQEEVDKLQIKVTTIFKKLVSNN